MPLFLYSAACRSNVVGMHRVSVATTTPDTAPGFSFDTSDEDAERLRADVSVISELAPEQPGDWIPLSVHIERLPNATPTPDNDATG